jgi:hypothetical protein
MSVQAQEVLIATNGGLQILELLYPGIGDYADKNKKFRLRAVDQDKSPSASIKKIDGNYVVTDFGEVPLTSRNGIQAYAYEKGLSWVDALYEIAKHFGIEGGKIAPPTIKPRVETRYCEETEEDGFGEYKLKESFSDFEIETILSKYVLKRLKWMLGEPEKKEAREKIERVFKKYNFKPVESYSWVTKEKGKHLTFHSTDEYPIFIIDEKDFQKLYQPFHAEKGRRFMYIGGSKKPKNFIHGLKQAEDDYNERIEEAKSNIEDYGKMSSKEQKEALKNEFKEHDSFILASGGSDALNLAVLGYWVGWMNSETAKLQKDDFSKLTGMFDKVYQLQDIDQTGKEAAHALALEYLDLHTIELPEALREKQDRRFNPCKDLRDFFNHYNDYDFKELVKIALPYRFWEKYPEYVGRGDSREFIGWKYELDNVQVYNFLSKNGFYRLPVEGEKEEYKYIQLAGNVVKESKPVKVKNYIHQFLIDRKVDKDLRNKMYNSTRLNETSLSNLPETTIDFTDNDETRQLLFFKNATWEVSKTGIKSHKQGTIKNFVWEKNMIDHHATILDKTFTITKDEAGVYDIDIHDQSCMFLQLLIQTSRIYWRKELEDELDGLPKDQAAAYKEKHHIDIKGPNLDVKERQEQVQHLINKIYNIGYLLHRYKDPSKTFSVIGMDNKINDDGGSHGGSGKSVILSVAIQKIWKNTFVIPGTSPKVTDNPHIYGGLNKHHQYVYMDDMDKYMKFRFFFPLITTDQPVNPKSATQYTLAFEDVPKLGITTNFTVMGSNEPSIRRRINYLVCGDWYHKMGEYGEYRESRDPKTDLGKSLFSEFDRDEWNKFYNTMARCLEFYLNTTDVIEPPMDNVSKRNMQTTMGSNFESWANVHFSEDSGNLDCLIIKEEAFAEFERRNKMLGWSMNKFTQAMKAFCHYHGYEFNPEDLKNTKDRRIIHRVEERELKREGWAPTGKLVSKELMYIRSDTGKPINADVPGKISETDL